MTSDDKKGMFRDIDADDEDPEITEIESLCMRCEEQVMLTVCLITGI